MSPFTDSYNRTLAEIESKGVGTTWWKEVADLFAKQGYEVKEMKYCKGTWMIMKGE